MAEPAQKFKDDGKLGNADSAPPGRAELEDMEDSSQSSNSGGSWYKGDKKHVDRDELSNIENSGDGPSQKEEIQHENQVGGTRGGYKSDKQNQKTGKNDWWRVGRRKRIAGGGIVGTIIALVFGFSVFQGPLQFIHLSHLLEQWHFSTQQDQQDDRFMKEARFLHYASSGEAEKTRLSISLLG
jgi:hypothetical protein